MPLLLLKPLFLHMPTRKTRPVDVGALRRVLVYTA